MTCSKVFLGDLPELTYEVIKYLQNDYSTLHSCVLVNRLWCRLAIPLLWENPFSIPTKNYNVIDIYLNDDLKTKLNEYEIIEDSLPSNTLFDYPSFLKSLNIYKFINSVEKWFETVYIISKPANGYYLKVFDLVSKSLFKIFIENKINLHTLEIEIPNTSYSAYINDILELILQNQNFIYNIRNLKLSISNFINYHDESRVIKNRISQMVNLQQNLKKILLDYHSFSLYQSLLLSKDYNCSNTLNTIIFYYVNFKRIINLDKIFEQLNVLESVHILYCYSLDTNFTQQIINLTKPFKLKSLFMSEILQIESFQLLLQKSGDYLENVGFITNFNLSLILSRQLLELFVKYCNNIKFLDFYVFERELIYKVFNLIENIKQNLNYLSIDTSYYFSDINNFVLRNLGQALPSKLEYLSLIHTVEKSYFKAFLENSQDIFINKLLINLQGDSDDILQYIKEYIMKEKRVKYLAIKNIKKDRELFDLKDEVKEFELHNIRVRRYSELFISGIDFIKNID
ncbi:hypothetical protein RhiirB3_521490 [Rhizophagus irregularis]|nr:hypothetical protein RhiirB3_521490 [Rhizophagus irregularis]